FQTSTSIFQRLRSGGEHQYIRPGRIEIVFGCPSNRVHHCINLSGLPDAPLQSPPSPHRGATGSAPFAARRRSVACCCPLSHRDKQRLLFAFFFAKSLLIGAKAYHQDDRRHPDLTGMNLDELNREEAATKIWRAYMNPNDKAFLEFVTQFAITNGGRHMQHAELLAVDYVKLLGFYEDVGE